MISQKKDRDINVKFEMKEKKKFYINNIPVKKTSEIIGKTYIVLFTPEDIGIINNEPSKRRRFLNIMISQLRPLYINLLSEYNKILESIRAECIPIVSEKAFVYRWLGADIEGEIYDRAFETRDSQNYLEWFEELGYGKVTVEYWKDGVWCK